MDNGPRATPTVAEGRVYTFGPDGMLHCLDLADGRKIWGVDTRKEFGLEQKWHGMAGSPLVEGKSLVLNVGGTNDASLVAFDKLTGLVRWHNGHDKFSCASPVAAVLEGRRQILFVTRSSFRSADPETGETLFKQPWRSRDGGSVNAASPLVIDDQIFISAGYGLGCQLWRAKGTNVESVWQSQELANQYATSIHYNGYLYGVHGQRETSIDLRCVELKTGRVQWSETGFGPATILLAGSELLILTFNGELIRAPASPAAFRPRQRAQILAFGARAYPALADGRFFARSARKMVCLDLRKN
jgi:outer membrane protein assembly factor BamB